MNLDQALLTFIDEARELFESARAAGRGCRALGAEGFQAHVARTLTLDEYRAAGGRSRVR